MKILIFGATGGLGKPLHGAYEDIPSTDVVGLSSREGDLRSRDVVKAQIETHEPDVIINAAGTNVDNLAHKYTEDEITSILSVNVMGLYNILHAAIPMMRAKEFGRVIHFSSILSQRPIPGTSLYAGCKAFADNLVKVAALENAKYGITCNSIQLGYFDGGLVHRVPEKILQIMLGKIPNHRLGTHEELFNAVDYLIKTPHVTGTNLQISGGLQI